jgi:hypothetical protein
MIGLAIQYFVISLVGILELIFGKIEWQVLIGVALIWLFYVVIFTSKTIKTKGIHAIILIENDGKRTIYNDKGEPAIEILNVAESLTWEDER